MVDVKLENVTKKFGGVTAVKDLNFHVKDRELMVLVGSSGCGKTTTLRLIAGLEEVDEGNIYFGDQLVNNVEIRDRGVAMVFQDYALYPHMTVFENMGFALKNMGYPKEEIRERVKKAADLLEIEQLLNRKPGQLSGGQQQRVALGKAIVREPKVFLWDEPLSNLDAKLRVKMRVEMQKLQRKLKTTTIHVTHDQLEAMTMGDRIAVMHEGIIKQLARPEEVYRNPADQFVAGFIGTPPINFINCSLGGGKGKLLLDAGEFAVPIPPKVSEVLLKEAPGKEVVLGVRPEDIRFADKKAKNQISAKVEVIEPIGSDNLIHLSIGGIALVARTSPSTRIRVGDETKIRFDAEKMHVFDRKTGRTII